MTERPTIHLVIATGGAYSDHVVWVVAAFPTEAEAVDCANQRDIADKEERLGKRPASYYGNWADDYTVVSLPIGEIGHWDIK